MANLSVLQAFSDRLQEPSHVQTLRRAAFDQLSEKSEVQLEPALPFILEFQPEDEAAVGRIAITMLGSLDATPAEKNPAMSAMASVLLLSLSTHRHYAYLTGALFLSIPDDVTFQHPLNIRWKSLSSWMAPHLVLQVGERSRIVITEILEGDAAEWSHGTELIIGEEAMVQYVLLQQTSPSTAISAQQRSHIEAGASLTWHIHTLGGKNAEQDVISEAIGNHATSSIQWLFYASEQERYALSCRNIFSSGNGSGEIVMRGVAEDQGHVSCSGMIDIGLEGKGTDTYLTQEVLMLDPTARIDAIPALEIKTNDVKASHSATVAHVTEEDLFYFASRGIDPAEAKGMFVQGFLMDLVEKVPDAELRETVNQVIEKKYVRS